MQQRDKKNCTLSKKCSIRVVIHGSSVNRKAVVEFIQQVESEKQKKALQRVP